MNEVKENFLKTGDKGNILRAKKYLFSDIDNTIDAEANVKFALANVLEQGYNKFTEIVNPLHTKTLRGATLRVFYSVFVQGGLCPGVYCLYLSVKPLADVISYYTCHDR